MNSVTSRIATKGSSGSYVLNTVGEEESAESDVSAKEANSEISTKRILIEIAVILSLLLFLAIWQALK